MMTTTRCAQAPGLSAAPPALPPRATVGRAKLGLIIAALAAFAAFLPSATGGEIASATFFGNAGTGHQQGAFVGGVDINTLVGADRFYAAGYTGTRATIANIEAGHIWKGHEALSHVQPLPTSSGALGESDRHATWVGAILGGRPDPNNAGPHQQGMAPDAALLSGAIATNWSPSDPPRYSGSFFLSISGDSTYAPYRSAFTGVVIGGTNYRADVINSSWNHTFSGSATGTDRISGVIDAYNAANPRTLMTVSAGNSVPAGSPNEVRGGATAYNNLSVGALEAATLYNSPTFFTNSGPNDYDDPTVSGVISQVRQVVDIAAPGEQIATAYYGGQTGGNRPSLGGSADGPAGGSDWYTRSVRGTSFSAPTVAGGAALLYDAAYDVFDSNPDARDARVMKAVLMNAADKTLGWDNGQSPHANGFGGVATTQGLDNQVGTGRMNLDRAFDQFLSGTTDVPGVAQGDLGIVQPVGWDFGNVEEAVANEYQIGERLRGGSTFSATLSWFRDRRLIGTTFFADDSYDNLDLELWEVLGDSTERLIAESASLYNNSEHFNFAVPRTSEYKLRVRWAGELFDQVNDINNTLYGLAWSGVAVPEPGAMLLVVLAMPAIVFAGGRRPR